MVEDREVVRFAVACAREAVDRIVTLIQADPPSSFEDALAPEFALIESLQGDDATRDDGRRHEEHAALSLLMGARNSLFPVEHELAESLQDDLDLRCVRCGKPVVRKRDQYDTFERMHWVCFHYEFEHSPADADTACGDPSCPARSIDPDAPPAWPTR